MCEGPPNSCDRAGQPETGGQTVAGDVPSPLPAGPASTAQPEQPSTQGRQAGEASAAAEQPLSLLELLQAFFEAQDVRGSTYQRLHAGFRNFVSARDEAAYRCATGSSCRSANNGLC